ncbi:AraC family transcriptional regulator [Flavobacterium sp.]|uniref:AraC family transcriptional regulator n=1 Tax=Flavobacterium sp. TaxID=239 RepID=UPI004033DA8E
MKAAYENVESKKDGASFVAYHSVVPYFEFKWHYHPEYELTLITQGEGKRLVGDSYENFEAGDLVLLGSGLPHTWSSEPLAKERTSAVVIQFSPEFINSFLQHAEFDVIRRLLDASHTGSFFAAEYSKPVIQKIKKLPDLKGIARITSLLDILQLLSTQAGKSLSSELFASAKGKENEERINKVCGYIQKHSAESISLDMAAGSVGLSNSAFCKFFKRVTGKTFSDHVNDIRTGNACRMLTESDKTISEIAFASGFESLTYFNRVFLKKKKMTPRDFRMSIKQ